ncbi:LysM peptidoglycan-binding domain-containing protein [Sphingobium subterraneum]|uniref:LysM domain-containing protein n=1 Tax=Sphingobium subterraneum TaxID=627688 RepID=A0A841J7S5_9SPHN|nr:LysM peptidoglycan-binding domain-containing protein [Sphingobium subterraneum]MBB6124231.1 hypothetical protein [Sphingobium subterraneum]
MPFERFPRVTVSCVVLLAALSACSTQRSGSLPRPATIQKIDNAQQIGDVVAMLERGAVKEGQERLRKMVKSDPADRASATLLASLTDDPIASLGSKSFAYRVQPGDRMTDLSQRFLGDRLKFFLLARYNGIAVPAPLKPGQVLRIPGDEPKVVAPRPAPAVVDREPEPPIPTPAPEAPPRTDPARAARLRAGGLVALNQGHVVRAVAMLREATALDPKNALIKRDLDRAQRIQKTVRTKR